eukprot:6471219-Amphidinium_carterae.1
MSFREGQLGVVSASLEQSPSNHTSQRRHCSGMRGSGHDCCNWCSQKRLVERPLELGRYKPYAAPLRSLCFRTQCCARPLAQVRVQADGRELGCSGRDGRIRLPPSRKEHFDLVMQDIPSVLLPGENGTLATVWQPPAVEQVEEEKDITVNCMVWIYAVSEAVEDVEEVESKEPAAISLWVSVNPDHIPEEAVPVRGQLLCPWGDGTETFLDGSTMGPFPHPPLPPRAQEADRCLLSCMELKPEPPSLYQYVASDPSPLVERCSELGGCEFQRLLKAPCVIGRFHPFPTPKRSLHFLTQCCRCSVEGVRVTIDGSEIGTSGLDGLVTMPKSRAQQCRVQLADAPLALLPGDNGYLETDWKLPGEATEECMEMVVHCHVWIYAIIPDSPEEQEEDAEGNEGGDLELQDITIWIAVDPDQIPDGAQPVRGEVTLPWTQDSKVRLDGTSMGPFPITKNSTLPEVGEHCWLSRMSLVADPEGEYEFKPKDPSPLQERCDELGGCELKRLLLCPVVIGHFKPFPTPSRSVCFRAQCCGRPMPGVHVQADGRDMGASGSDGCIRLPPSRKEQCTLALSDIPSALLS